MKRKISKRFELGEGFVICGTAYENLAEPGIIAPGSVHGAWENIVTTWFWIVVALLTICYINNREKCVKNRSCS